MNNHTQKPHPEVWHGAAWNAGLTSSYTLGADLLRNGSDNRVKLQTVTASLRPLNTPDRYPYTRLSDGTARLVWRPNRSPSASLAMNYQQSQRLIIGTMGNYSAQRSSDRLIDLETIGGKALSLNIQQSRGWTTLTVSLEGYNLQTNRVMSYAGNQNISWASPFRAGSSLDVRKQRSHPANCTLWPAPLSPSIAPRVVDRHTSHGRYRA